MSAFSFMRDPDAEETYEVGDVVEVFCEHDNAENARVRDWIEGVVVQVDEKMVAVQFRVNVYLTNGWMVPDRILWFPLRSPHVRLPNEKK